VDSKQQKTFKIEKEGKMKQEQKTAVVSILHQNVQSLNSKLVQLNVILQTELEEVEVLCLSEHWMREEYINFIKVDGFKLTSNFSRSKSIHGGTCIYVKNYLQTREVNYIKEIGKEKDFEMSAVEILDYDLIFVCVYRSSDGDFSIFIRNLESVIQKVKVRKKQLILCGDWNINFMQESKRLCDVQELLSLHNLVNTVRSPTRVTNNTESLIDVVITDKESVSDIATVIDLEYSNHKAQVLQLTVQKMLQKWKVITSRQYSEKRVEEFKYRLSKEHWQEVYQKLEVNSALQIFMENFGYYFNIAFPYKLQILEMYKVINGLQKV
jgi:exonuclease III